MIFALHAKMWTYSMGTCSRNTKRVVMMNPRAKGREVLDQRSLRRTTVAQEYVSMECNAFCLPIILHVASHAILRNAFHALTQKMIAQSTSMCSRRLNSHTLLQRFEIADVVKIAPFVHSSKRIHTDHASYQLVPTIVLIYVMNASMAKVWLSAVNHFQ